MFVKGTMFHAFVKERMDYLPIGFLWNDENKKLWSKT